MTGGRLFGIPVPPVIQGHHAMQDLDLVLPVTILDHRGKGQFLQKIGGTAEHIIGLDTTQGALHITQEAVLLKITQEYTERGLYPIVREVAKGSNWLPCEFDKWAIDL